MAGKKATRKKAVLAPHKRPNLKEEKFYLRPEKVGHRFRLKLDELVARAGYSSVERLAEAQGWDDWVLSGTVLRGYLNGYNVPTIDALVPLARALGVSIAYLADDDIDDPRAHMSVEALPEGERMLIEKGRQLGVERAAVVLETVSAMGYARFWAIVGGSLDSGRGAKG